MALINVDEKKMNEEFPEIDVNTVNNLSSNLTTGEKTNPFTWLLEHKLVMVCGIAVIVLIVLAVIGFSYLNSMIVADDHEHVYVDHICKYCDKEETYDITYTDESGTHTVSYSYLAENITKPRLTQKLGYSAAWGEVVESETGEKTVQAVYTLINNKINYHIDIEGIENNSKNPATYTVKDSFDLYDIEIPGYYFAGWYTDTDYKVKVTNIAYNSVGDIDLYAKISANQTLISFNLNSGSGNVPTVSVDALDTYTFEEVDVERRSYKFVGWSIVKDGEVKYHFGDTITASATNVKMTLYAVWEKNKTIITFNPNGGEGEEVTQEFQCFIPTAITSVNYSKNAASLAGWSLEKNGSLDYEVNGVFTAGEDEASITLYAKWNTNSNIISFDANGGIGQMSSITIESLTSSALPQCGYTFEGSKFIGWSTVKENGTVEYKENSIYLASAEQVDIVLYAVWAVNDEITIHFNSNGGVGYAADITVELLNSVNLPINGFVKPGLTFAGWALSSLGEIAYTDTYTYNKRVIGAEITLYAVYDENRTTFKFNANGGTGTMDSQVIAAGKNGYINENEFTYPGYKFLGWSYTKNGTVDVYDKAFFEAGDNLVTYDLYAVWERNVTTIIFKKNGANGAMLNQEVLAGETVSISANKFEKDNCYFAGWALEPTGEIVYADCGEYTPSTENITLYLYAVFKTNKTLFHYNANGGTGEMADSEILYNSKGYISECAFTNTNYSFIGWCEDPVYEGQDLYTSSLEYSTGMDFKEITLYAIWRRNKTTITFKSVNSTEVMSNVEVLAGDKINLPKNIFTRSGYTFIGWSVNVEGITVYFDEGEFTGFEENTEITLVPSWEINKVIITYNPNGGTGYIAPENLNAFQKISLPKCTFEKENMHFVGWGVGTRDFVNYEEYEEYFAPDDLGEVIIYAIWEVNIQPVKLVYNNGTGTEVTIDFDVVNGDKINILPEKEEYEFVGWTLFSYGDTPMYAPDEYIVLGVVEEYTLYGVFKPYIGTIGLVYTEIYDNDEIVGYEVVDYDGTVENVIIPGKVNGKSVCGIADNAFENNSVVKSIKFVNNITYIGNNAFKNCTNLSTIDFGKKLVTIGNNAFENTKFENVTIPSTVTSIGEKVFYNCSSLNEVVLSSGINSISKGMFSESTLTSVIIPTNIKTIKTEAFNGCEQLLSVTFNEGLTAIEEKAFYNCTSLAGVVLPNSLLTIGKEAFGYCSSLATLSFGNKLTDINALAFEYNTALTEVTVPANVTFMGEGVFKNSGLVTAVINANITYVNKSLFANCLALTSVTLPNTIVNIFNNAFNGCFLLNKIIIPASVTNIYADAFANSSLNTIFYASTAANWELVNKGENAIANSVNVYYYSETEPASDVENFWHYVNNNPRRWTIQ